MPNSANKWGNLVKSEMCQFWRPKIFLLHMFLTFSTLGYFGFQCPRETCITDFTRFPQMHYWTRLGLTREYGCMLADCQFCQIWEVNALLPNWLKLSPLLPPKHWAFDTNHSVTFWTSKPCHGLCGVDSVVREQVSKGLKMFQQLENVFS